MAYSIKTHTGDGVTTDFLFDLPYLDTADVHGYTSGVENSITFVDPTTVRFTTAPPVGTNNVTIKRLTSTTPRYTFPDSTYLKSTKLDGNQLQAMYLAEESADITGDLVSYTSAAANYAADAANQVALAADQVALATDQVGLAEDQVALATTAKEATQLAYDNFDDRYLGAKPADPELDNDGNALLTGAMYFSSTTNVMRIYNGSLWDNIGATQNSASGINLTDAGEYYTTDNVEAALQELVPKIGLNYTASLTPFKNLIIATPNTAVGNYQVNITAGDLLVSDGVDDVILSSVNLTADITASGENGLDTGAEANDTWYYIWVIYNGSTTAALLSTSNSTPTMPSGYTFKGLVGTVRNHSSSFRHFKQINTQVSSATSSYNNTVAALTLVDISAAVPVEATEIEGVMVVTDTTTVMAGGEIANQSTFYTSYSSVKAYQLANESVRGRVNLMLDVAQTIYMRSITASNTSTVSVSITGFKYS